MDPKHLDEKTHISARVQNLIRDGNRLLEAGNAEGAKECFRRAQALIRAFGGALANLASLQKQDGELEDAEKYHGWASALLPDNPGMQSDPGVLLDKQNRLAETEADYLRQLRSAPDSPAAWTNLGVILARMKRDDEAERCYRTAIELDSDHSPAYFNLAYVLLRRGNFEEGWHCLERRKSHGYLDNYFTFPRWGGEPLNGKSLIIGFEGGHGDMIQFCRYATVLKEMGATRISLTCQPGLRILFETLSGVDEVLSFPWQVPASGWDFWTLPLSLPYHCRTRLHNIPAPIPYLQADPARTAKWSPLLPPSGFKIGLVWKGNANFENDEDRSLPSLDVLAPLGKAPGVHFVSLQKGPGEEEARRPPAGLPLLALGRALGDFADTAAIVACLDLVISVDTAVVHLAGALGKPCWVLLPDHLTDWRWLTGRTDSPWYPKRMRLFRQSRAGTWSPVIADVLEAIKSCT